MTLDSTFYPNISRKIISGITNLVFADDVILLCDTTTGAIIIQLAEIPTGYWNTIYKLYVVDAGSNSSVNNVTINAPVGFLINGLPSITMNTNDDTFLIRIANDTNYLSSSLFSSAGNLTTENQGIVVSSNTQVLDFVGLQASLTSPNNIQVNNAFISGTYNNIITLGGSGSLIPNQWYNINNAIYGYFNHNFNVYVPALTNKSISTWGIGEFYNADYQNIGNYSGIVGFGGWLGIWNNTLVTPLKSVVIWDNIHYLNITGVNGAVNPSADIVNWSALTYSTTNGYVLEYNEINMNANRIVYRKDLNNNEVELTDQLTYSSFDKFPFGNTKFVSNKVLCQSLWECCNTTVVNEVKDNRLSKAWLTWYDLINGFTISECTGNIFDITTRQVLWKTGNNNFVCNSNQFLLYEGDSIFDGGLLAFNVFENSSIKWVTDLNTFISGNFINKSSVDITLRDNAVFQNNQIFASDWQMISIGDSVVNYNFLSNSSLTVASNQNLIAYNSLSSNSVLSITNILVLGTFEFNCFTNTNFVIQQIGKPFGNGGVSGKGNVFTNGSNITIGNYTGDCQNNYFNATALDINIFDGILVNSKFDSKNTITINNMNGFTISYLNCNQIILGSAGFNMYESYINGTYCSGVGTISCTLDCSDATIYDLASTTLTIPSTLNRFGGKIILSNANGLVITKIANTIDNAPYTFFNDNGTTDFSVASIGVAVSEELIYTNPAPATYTITYRVNGSDNIKVNRNGVLLEVLEMNIFA